MYYSALIKYKYALKKSGSKYASVCNITILLSYSIDYRANVYPTQQLLLLKKKYANV